MNFWNFLVKETTAFQKHIRSQFDSELDHYLEKVDDEKTLYVLVPGFLERGNVFAHQELPEGVKIFRYNSLKDMRISGEKLSSFIHGLNMPEKIRVIGRSEGGLVARWAIQAEGADKYVKLLATIGTPHQGTGFAQLSKIIPKKETISKISKSLAETLDISACYQMMPNSDFLNELNSLSLGKLEKAINIYTETFDELIWPHENAIWPYRENDGRVINLKIPGVDGHASLLYNPEAWKEIKKALKIDETLKK